MSAVTERSLNTFGSIKAAGWPTRSTVSSIGNRPLRSATTVGRAVMRAAEVWPRDYN